HAQSIGGAWSANMAAAQIAVWLVATLPDVPARTRLRGYGARALARADWIITPSNFAAAPIVARYKIPRERLSIIPRSIDIDAFDAATIAPERIAALRKSWHISANERILLVPGRVAPWNGQIILADVARALLERGARGFVFVLAGEHQSYRKYARVVVREAQAKGVGAFFRLVGPCRDRPAA